MRCAVFGFFRFPKDHQFQKLWRAACCRNDRFNIAYATICSKHFDSNSYSRNLKYELLNYMPKNARILKSDAVPSLFLPTSESPVGQNSSTSGLSNIMRTTEYYIMPKFCANLSFLFPEKPFLERFQLAKDCRFKAVETGFPVGLTIQEVVDAKNAAGVQQILINVYTGDVTKGELGFAAIPGKEDEFKKSIETTIAYAKALGANKIHIMSGRVEGGNFTAANDLVYELNLRYAVELLEKENIMGLIEPINPYSIPHYYMNSYDKALSVIKRIKSPNLKLMLDIFHLQLIKGNISNSIRQLIDFTGHVQIAQAPHRNEPNSRGEINYEYVIDVLQEVGYNDWIGLEYTPLGDTKEGLKWLEEFGYM